MSIKASIGFSSFKAQQKTNSRTMKSYWFLRISVHYNNVISRRPAVIVGNAIHALDSESFLPGTVTRTLNQSYKEALLRDRKINPEDTIQLLIDSVLKVDEAAMKDYTDNNTSTGGLFVLYSAEHYQELAVVTITH